MGSGAQATQRIAVTTPASSLTMSVRVDHDAGADVDVAAICGITVPGAAMDGLPEIQVAAAPLDAVAASIGSMWIDGGAAVLR